MEEETLRVSIFRGSLIILCRASCRRIFRQTKQNFACVVYPTRRNFVTYDGKGFADSSATEYLEIPYNKAVPIRRHDLIGSSIHICVKIYIGTAGKAGNHHHEIHTSTHPPQQRHRPNASCGPHRGGHSLRASAGYGHSPHGGRSVCSIQL